MEDLGHGAFKRFNGEPMGILEVHAYSESVVTVVPENDPREGVPRCATSGCYAPDEKPSGTGIPGKGPCLRFQGDSIAGQFGSFR